MPGDKVDLAKRFVEVYNRRDVDGAFAEFVTPDFEWWPALTRAVEGGCYRGREGVERFVADTSENWEELQIVPEEFRDLGDPCSRWLGSRDAERAAAPRSTRRPRRHRSTPRRRGD
jgi:ketosteroid isomerase-like protein